MPSPPSPSDQARRTAYLHGRAPTPPRFRRGAPGRRRRAAADAASLRGHQHRAQRGGHSARDVGRLQKRGPLLQVQGLHPRRVGGAQPLRHRRGLPDALRGPADESLGARLVVGDESERPALVLHNESDIAWQEVLIIVNGRFRAAISHVEPHAFVTVTPKQLLGDNGKVAPSDLRATDVELRTNKSSVVLLEHGQMP